MLNLSKSLALCTLCSLLILMMSACQKPEESIDAHIVQESDVLMVNAFLTSEGANPIELSAAQNILDWGSDGEPGSNERWGYQGEYAGENTWISLV